jgi:hypothetical protein
MAWPRRVPYEWLLGAMFVGSFVLAESGQWFPCRVVWLILIAPAAGLALGVKRKPWDRKPRGGVVLLAGAFGWLMVATAILGAGLVEHWSRDAREIVHNVLFVLTAAAGAAGLLGLFTAATAPGRYRELGVFLSAALLLLFAFLLDAMLTPRS